jgi:iron complex outermembrane receptor protein
VRKNLHIFILFCSGTGIAFSQTKDSSAISLKEVEITGVQNKQFIAGKKVQQFDSLTKQNFSNSNLAELLSVNSPVFVKNYGPASLSTSSFRGGNASQTAILWNGFNIQNNMLGQNDVSQIPNFIFDDIGIEYGGSAAVWGSGAMGGSIHLNNKPRFNKGVTTSINLGVGSYETKKLNSLIHYSSQKFSFTTKVYLNRSKNDFDYKDTTIKQQSHADYLIKGFLQEISYLFLKNQKLTVRAWYNSSFRDLPATLGTKKSSASQTDENLKLNGDWTYQGKKLIPSIRFAYFDDNLNYTDSASKLFSKSKIKTLITEGDANYLINEHHKIYFGLNYTNYAGTTLNYLKPDQTFTKEAILLGYHTNYFENKLNLDFNLRQEFSKGLSIPITGSAGASYQLFKQLKLKANAAKVYRLPTLNDLYWNPGGNPSLKPEEGYTYEGSFELKIPFRGFLLESEMTYFNKTISNWIQWIPGPGGNPTPINLMKVYSRGTETSSRISFGFDKFKSQIGFNSAYVLSTSLQSNLENDASVNKQLIYTPRYNYGGNFSLTYDKFNVSYYHNYVGYRFTSSDNSSWLKPYQYANLKFSYQYGFEKLKIITAFHLNNIYNSSYMVIAQRPMPLRNYEVSLTLTYNKPNKTKTQQL